MPMASPAWATCCTRIRWAGWAVRPRCDQFAVGWHAPRQVTGSPVVGGNTVYSLDPGGTLYALNSQSGEVISTVGVDQTSRFATPTLYDGRVFVGTLSGVAAVSAS